MSARTPTQAVSDAFDNVSGIYGDLYAAWLDAATRLSEAFAPGGSASPFPALPTLLQLPAAACGREIPPACWMPHELGELSSTLCQGQTATICLRIVNRSVSARTFVVESGSDHDGLVISGSPIKLGPMEERTVTAAFTSAAQGERRFLLWVRGCHQHLLRWTITDGSRAEGHCHHVDVDDGPDNVHHWYDHFYCAHPCEAHRG